jgi:uncharacterized membrane protein
MSPYPLDSVLAFGAVPVAAVAAITGALRDYGINDKFIKQVSAGVRRVHPPS